MLLTYLKRSREMKKIILNNKLLTPFLLCLVSCILPIVSLAQVGVGINYAGVAPNTSALLDIDAGTGTKKGLLIPRIALVSSTDATTIAAPAATLMVYNLGTGGLTPAGYYYNSGTSGSPVWVQLLNGGSPGTSWNISGNAGTTAGTHFLGTTDATALVFKTNNTEALRILSGGNVGIGITNPSHKLFVEGNTYVNGSFNIGSLYYSGLQTISVAAGTETWINLVTIPNNHYVRIQFRAGSNNSEEMATIDAFGTYFINTTGITVQRQTYNDHLEEVRVTGTDAGPKTVYIRIKTSTGFAPTVNWRVIESNGSVTINNIEASPTGGAALIVSGNLVTATNTDFRIAGSVGIGTTSPSAKLHIVGPNGAPASSGTTQNAHLRLSPVGDVTLDMGVNASSNYSWLQSNDLRDLSINYFLALNPNGGNVGIGTTAPTAKLQLGSVYSLSFNSDGATLNNAADAAIFHNGYLYNNAGAVGYKWVTTHGGFGSRGIQFGYGTPGSDGIKFFADGVASTADAAYTPTQRMIIANNGNVGIGLTNPGAQLQVNSSAARVEIINSTSGVGGYLEFQSSGTSKGLFGAGATP
jgi:hypothetical protein